MDKVDTQEGEKREKNTIVKSYALISMILHVILQLIYVGKSIRALNN